MGATDGIRFGAVAMLASVGGMGAIAATPAASSAQVAGPLVSAVAVPGAPAGSQASAALSIAPDGSAELFELAGAVGQNASIWKASASAQVSAPSVSEINASTAPGFPEALVAADSQLWAVHNGSAGTQSGLVEFSGAGAPIKEFTTADTLGDLAIAPNGKDLEISDNSGGIQQAVVTPGSPAAVTFNAFADTVGSGHPDGIASAGGAIWFSDSGANLAAMTPAGTYGGPFAIGQATNLTHSVVAGADGNLYAIAGGTGATVGGDQILQVAPSGASAGSVSKTFTLPAGAAASSITSGPDGNIWFTDAGNGEIGQLVLASGQVNEFALPTGFDLPPAFSVAIKPGPSNTLWFSAATTTGAPAIGEISGIGSGGTGGTGGSGGSGGTGGTGAGGGSTGATGATGTTGHGGLLGSGGSGGSGSSTTTITTPQPVTTPAPVTAPAPPAAPSPSPTTPTGGKTSTGTTHTTLGASSGTGKIDGFSGSGSGGSGHHSHKHHRRRKHQHRTARKH